MKDKYATILFHVETVPFYGKRYSYTWEGKHDLPVRINDLTLYEANHKFPWPMIELDYEPWNGMHTFLRTDTYTWWITWALEKVTYLVGWVNVRLLATCMIWGLMDHIVGFTPKWDDLKILRWFK